MTTAEKIPNAYNFKTEVKQLLNILVHSLYKEQDIFLRELVSNASDALTRLHFETLTNRDIFDPDAELAIYIEAPEVEDDQPKRIIIKDTGIGMTKDELVTNLGTIAQSGAREFLAKLESDEEIDPTDVIGQFGVGFYSVFMVADEVRVFSRSYKKRAKAAVWVSDGSERFTVETAEKPNRGTEIHVTLKKDAEEFANSWKLKQIVKKYSDFVRYPIYVDGEQANEQESLWRKRPSDVTEEDYKKFYQQMTMDFEPPVAAIHFAADAPVNVRAMLFIPAKREPGILAARKEPGVMLYSHNVLIQEYCTDLLPDWLNFVDGVVDSEDLSLNVSREMVQNNRIVQHLAKTVRGRVLRQIKRLAEKEPEKYAQFWQEFGRVFKEGLATDFTAKEEIMPLLRYPSSKSDGKLVSLDTYLENMAESQEEIFYVLADDVKSAGRSPHLDQFKERDLEVLLWVDPLDAFLAPMLPEYKGKKLRNIDDAGLELPDQPETETDDDQKPELAEADFNRFVGKCVTTLGERVVEVRESKVLKNSPVRLVSPRDAQNREMDRIQRFMDKDYQAPKRILEVNRRHPLIADLAHLVTSEPDNPLVQLGIEQLYESALLQEGLHPNPADMLPRIQQLLEIAAGQAVTEPS